ncbi:MAG TPA: choice-of-anchor M domain-containing protein [Iamia sp.]|nr:choice-of-anchor M domain-containing protein [Iamia sp.]
MRARPLVLAALVALALAAPAGAQATTEPDLDQTIDADQGTATGPADLALGHVDMGPRFVDGDWTLMIHDDAVEPSVWRSLDDAVLQVGDTALLPVPDDPNYDFLGLEAGTEVHVVPQTQAPDVVWLGWNTQDPEVLDAVDRGVTMSLLGVDGPGTVTMYLQAGNLEPPDVLWTSETDEAQPVWVELDTHTHANWVFSEPGVYLLRVEVAADLISGATVTDTRTVRFAVGDATDPDDARAAAFDGPVAEAPAGGAGEGAAGGPGPAGAPAGGGDEGGVPLGLVAAGLGAALVLVAVATVLGVRGSRAKRRAEADRYDGHRADGPGSGEGP